MRQNQTVELPLEGNASHDAFMPSAEYEKLLSQIRDYCSQRGRKTELAKELGVSPALVSLWLRGERMLTLEQWLSISKIIKRRRR